MDPSGMEFIAQEVLSGRILGDVRMVDFKYREIINEFGDWSGKVILSEDDIISQVEMTQPWKVRLIAHRDGEIAFGLDIWTRKRKLGDTSMQVAGKLCGSWLERVIIGGRNGGDLGYNQWEQQDIARDLVNKAQAEWGYGGLEAGSGSLGQRIYRDKNTWEASDGKPYGEALMDLMELQNGAQFRFEVYSPSDGQFAVRMVTGYPYCVERAPIYAELTDDGSGQMTGNIVGLEQAESVAVLATDAVVWGSGEGNARLRGTRQNGSLSNAMPRIARTENRNDVGAQYWLDWRAQTLVNQSTTAEYAPEISLAADDPNHPVGSYVVGDKIAVNVDPCIQFPYGLQGTWRIMEIEYNPNGHGQEVALVIGDRT